MLWDLYLIASLQSIPYLNKKNDNNIGQFLLLLQRQETT